MMYRLISFLLLALTCVGCQEDFGQMTESSSLVVEGWIEAGSFPVVQVSRTLPVSTHPQDVSVINDYLVRWAKVTVSDGESEVVLTGLYDESYYPPFVYTTSDMRGEPGRHYTLTVQYRDYCAKAETTIPDVAPRQCDYRVAASGESDTLYQIEASPLPDGYDAQGYYQFFTSTDAAHRQYQPSLGGTLDGAALASAGVVTLHRGHRWDLYPYTPCFSQSEVVNVKLARMDSVSNCIWRSYTEHMSLSNLMFLAPSADLETNILGGYGYWCGYNAVRKRIVIADSLQ